MDKSDKKAIKGFMLPVIGGTVILEVITVLVFLIIGKFDLAVVFGALWGTAVMTVYYFLMARAVTKAAGGDPDEAKKRIQASYSMRLLLLVVLMGAGLYVSTNFEVINWIPMLLAVVFPRISIGLWQIVSNTKKMLSEEKDGD